MKLFEFAVYWEVEDGTQVAYAYCNAATEKAARKIILESVPHDIHLGDAAKYPYNAARGETILLWYFDKYGEHHDVFTAK